MKVSDVLPSEYLEAANLGGRDCRVTIDRVEDRHSGKGTDGKPINKPLLHFQGKKKGMILNKTNAKVIRDKVGLGDEMQSWVGREITIYPTTCDAFGEKNKPCIRVRPMPAGINLEPSPLD